MTDRHLCRQHADDDVLMMSRVAVSRARHVQRQARQICWCDSNSDVLLITYWRFIGTCCCHIWMPWHAAFCFRKACDRMKPRKTLHFRTNSLWQSFALDPELDGWMFGWILHITHYFSWKLLNCMPENVIGCTTPVLILLTKFSPANLLFFDKNKTIAK